MNIHAFMTFLFEVVDDAVGRTLRDLCLPNGSNLRRAYYNWPFTMTYCEVIVVPTPIDPNWNWISVLGPHTMKERDWV